MHAKALARFLILVALLIGCKGPDDDVWNRDLPRVDARAASAVAGDPMGVVIEKLPNGLTVMLSENHQTPRFTAWIAVRTGSAKDPARTTGLAHYLEHMLFKGSTRLGTLDWEKEKPHLDAITDLYDQLFETTDAGQRAALYAQIDEHSIAAGQYSVPNEFDHIYDVVGGRGLNAFTSTDRTVYIVDLPANRMETWARVEADRFRDPVFRLFQTELEAVYEEKNQSLDNKNSILREALMLGLFPEHPYGTQTTLGKVEHLKNPSLKEMYAYYRRWYVPANMTIALSGDFNRIRALEVIEEHFGAWKQEPVPADPVHPTPKPEGRKFIEVTYDAEEMMTLAFVTVPAMHPDADALTLCDMLLDNSQTGFINVNLGQAQRVLGAGSYPMLMIQAGAQALWSMPKPGQTLEEVEKLLLEQVSLLKEGKFSDDDLAAILTDFEVNEKQSLESNDARVGLMVDAYIEQVDWQHKVDEIARLRKTTREQVIAAANKYFGDDFVVVYRRSGKSEVPKIEKPKFTNVNLEEKGHSSLYQSIIDAKVQPLDPYFLSQGRDYRQTSIRCGQVTWTRNPMNDLFSLTFRFPLGTDHDPALETALDLVELGGAGDLDPVAYKRKLYALGSSISMGASRQETIVTVSGLEAKLVETLALLRDHMERPSGLDAAVLKKLVERTVGLRESRIKEPGEIARALAQFGLRGKASAYLVDPSNATLQTFRPEDLIASVRGLWNLKRRVAYVGRIETSKVGEMLDEPDREKELQRGPPRQPVLYLPSDHVRILFVDKKTAQARVGIYAPNGAFNADAAPLWRVYNEYMSGSMGSVVFQEIRESRALAYSCWCNYRPGAYKADENLFFGALGTQADKTLEAVEVFLGIIRKMPSQPARFEQVKRTVDEQYRNSRINFRRVPGAIQGWENQGYASDPRAFSWKQVEAMKLADLDAFAARFSSMPFTITVVGDKDRIDLKKLAAMGEVVELTTGDLFSW